MTARRALLNDEIPEIVETAEPVATPRRAVMPALADMAVESPDSRTITALHSIDSRTTGKASKGRRRFVAPVTAVAAVSAIGVISTLVPAAATNNPSTQTSASPAENGSAFQSNAFAVIQGKQAADEALDADIAALGETIGGADTAAGTEAGKAADTAKEKEEADKAAAAALAEQEAAAANAATTATSSAASSPAAPSVAASSGSAQAAVNFALAQLGKPYVYGATGPDGYDCSGLMVAAYAAAGVSIPRTSQAQMSGLTSVSTSDLQPGDLVFFYGGSHVGMYIGDGQVVHAPTEGDVVKIASISSMGGASAAARVA